MSDAEHTVEHQGKQPFTVLLMMPDHMQADESCAADCVRRIWLWAEDAQSAAESAPKKCIKDFEWQDICEPEDLAPIAVYPGKLYDLLPA